MIDLHCHILPSIDDGAKDLETSIGMARLAIDDGIELMACTPHIYPGLYENTSQIIKTGVIELQKNLDTVDIPLKLSFGADTHMVPDLMEKLQDKQIPTLNDSRYLLFEPPHHVEPMGFEDYVFNLIAQGIVPIITHPERLTWIEQHYDVFDRLARRGAWLQVTAGSLTQRFGRRAKYSAERLVGDGIVQILATDAHGIDHRPPILSEGRIYVEKVLGSEEAQYMVKDRPQGIIDNKLPDELPNPPGLSGKINATKSSSKPGFFKALFTK